MRPGNVGSKWYPTTPKQMNRVALQLVAERGSTHAKNLLHHFFTIISHALDDIRKQQQLAY